MSQITDHVKKNLPRFLSNVAASPIDRMLDDRGDDYVTFRISNGHHETCQVIGHDLNCDDSEYSGPLEYVGPIFLAWPDDTETPLFDSEIHGYHGEMESSAKIHGIGDAAPYRCNQCGDTTLTVEIQLNYYDDLFDEFEPHEVADYFHNILIYGTCPSCSNINRIVNMDL